MINDPAIRRLRAANIVAAASAVDSEELFARITSVAPEPRRDVIWFRRRRGLLVLALGLIVVAVVASTAPAVSNWFGDIIGPSEVHSEYGQAQQELSLPPGASWPKLNFPANSVTSRGGGGSFAVANAMAAWECYWVQTIRDRDVAGGRRAHAALNDLLTKHVVVAPNGASENWSPPQANGTPTAVFADDGGYQYKQRMYAEAAAGHPQLLEQS